MAEQGQRAGRLVALEAVAAECKAECNMVAQPHRVERPVVLEAVAAECRAECRAECNMAGQHQRAVQHRRAERHQRNISTDCYFG